MRSAEVQQKTFTARRFRNGYAVAEIEDYLQEVAETLAHYERRRPGQPRLSDEDIVHKQFMHVRFAASYDPDEVDDFLDECVVAIRSYQEPMS